MNAKKILAIILSVIFITVSLTSCGFVSIDEPDVTDENGDVIIQTDKNGETTKKPASTNKNNGGNGGNGMLSSQVQHFLEIKSKGEK